MPCFLLHSGENPLPADDPNKELMGKTEVSLTLTNKFDVPGEANAEMDAKTLLLKWVQTAESKSAARCLSDLFDFSHLRLCVSLSSTKRLIVDVIRFQPGETLTEILDSTANPEQVGSAWRRVFLHQLSVIWMGDDCNQVNISADGPVYSACFIWVENYWAALRPKTGTDFYTWLFVL